MSKLRIGIIGVLTVVVILMSLSLIVSAVDEKREEQEKAELAAQNAIVLYQTQVAELEKKLENIKEEQYVNNKAYEEKIEELELKLEAKNEETTTIPTKPVSDAVYTYTVTGDKITITGYSGTDSVLEIPEEIDGLSIVEIGREAFKGACLEEVSIPASVKKIDWFAFSECVGLKRVYMPSTVEKIEYGVFDGAHNVTIYCVKNSYAYRYAKSYGFDIEIQ